MFEDNTESDSKVVLLKTTLSPLFITKINIVDLNNYNKSCKIQWDFYTVPFLSYLYKILNHKFPTGLTEKILCYYILNNQYLYLNEYLTLYYHNMISYQSGCIYHMNTNTYCISLTQFKQEYKIGMELVSFIITSNLCQILKNKQKTDPNSILLPNDLLSIENSPFDLLCFI